MGGVDGSTVSVKRIVRSCERSVMLVVPKEESNFDERTNLLHDTVISTVAFDLSEVVRNTADASKIR